MSVPPKIAVIGASGFIGQALVREMMLRGIPGIAASSAPAPLDNSSVKPVRIRYDAAFSDATFEGAEVAIMLAGRAHVLREQAPDPERAFLEANRDLPVVVADAFARSGGRRFVFVSTVAVHGVVTHGRPFEADDPFAPVSAYARSKRAGEDALRSLCSERGLELVIIRPPLVFGPNAPGNFGQLIAAAKRGIPLPLRSISNRRSFISLHNLVDLLLHMAAHSEAAGRAFLVSDGPPLSTAEVALTLYRAAGHPNRVLPCPPALLRTLGRWIGREAMIDRLIDDLEIDSTPARELLGWRPPHAIEAELQASLEKSVTRGRGG
jgi:nucleoside-diphosphate-sugar epimerase